MLEASFDYPPTLELLDDLVPGVLGQKGNLLKAVRLWVILRSLYGDLELELSGEGGGWFSSAQWRDAFLHPDHRTQSLQQWLFTESTGIDQQQWEQRFVKRYGEITLDTASPPFQIDDRTLRNDFVTLEKLGWLQATGTGSQRRYCKVTHLPEVPWMAPPSELSTIHFIPNDLATVVDHFPQPINGIQRFILDVEYIISQSVSHQVERILQDLKQLWHQEPGPPVRLT